MHRKILIVEDHANTVHTIKKGLTEQHIEVDIALDGKSACNMVLQSHYDVIISDIIMPEMNGIEFCTFLRTKGIKTPVLLLSALDSTDMKITGLEAGGDDYLTKPFEFKELLARVRALNRRNKDAAESDERHVVTIGDLIIDMSNKTVHRGSGKIDLTPREYKLLEYLVQKKGQVVSKAELI